jgi:hypothetical protein
MILPNDLKYYSESSSDPAHASSYPDQYLGATQSANSTYDSDERQQRELSIAADRDPKWFTDFVLYDSDDSTTEADAMSVLETSESVTVDSNSGTLPLPLLDLLSESVPESIDGSVPDSTSLYRWLKSTELDIEDNAAGLGSTDNNSQWATEPILGLFVSKHSENAPGTHSELSSPCPPIPAQNDMPNKVAVPRLHHYICPTCKRHCTSPSRLRFVSPKLFIHFLLSSYSEHHRKYHQPPRFICSTCSRGFKAEKDLIRHNHTHGSSKRTFACSCTKPYHRLDSLTRHIARMAEIPAETGRHKPV